MFDMDGDGDIDQFDEELFEYGLLLFEDEMLEDEHEKWLYNHLGYEEYMRQKRLQNEREKEDWGKSCLYGTLILIGFFVVIIIIIAISAI